MSYSIDIYDQKWKVVSSVKLNAEIFSDSVINESLIHEYVLLQSSNARYNIASVKGRWEVVGSGKKLFRQKGTGNARVGDKYSPIRVGWGVAFGPRWERNFKKSMNKKARAQALAWIITIKAKEKELMWLKSFDMSAPKTKDMVDLIKNIGVDGKKTLFVLDTKNELIEKSLRNIKNIKYVKVWYLNPLDLLWADRVVFFETAVDVINTK